MAPPGVAVVIASMEDPLFGPLVSFGLGGVATELLHDRAYRIPPLSASDAAEMVRSVGASPLLFGYRGATRVDVAALERLLLCVAQLADDLPELASLELNPVLVGTRALSVIGATGRVAPPRSRTDRGLRALSG
jgi:acyl-CoA synthetase (NDP forming)